ncbi:MAG: hypothetical protein JXA16_14825, partial [Bacteroidales bacterium]|nr:hypothetical protein [Bacteroidales bacterium]
MNNLNLFIIKSSLILFVFYIGFWLFLRKSSYFKLNRIYLLSGLILSLIIPFLNFQLHESAQTEIFITLDSIDISSNKILNTSQNAIDWFGFFPIFYYSIAVLLTFKFLFQLFSLINLFLHSEKEKQNGFNLILTNKNNANFSFFNYA